MKYLTKSVYLIVLAVFAIFTSSCNNNLSKNYYSTIRFSNVAENDKKDSIQYYQKITKVGRSFDFIEIDLSLDEPECREISYQVWNSDIVGDHSFPYHHKMLILDYKSPKKDTSNFNLNKKETFSFTKKRKGYEYKSDMKMLTVPQLRAKIIATENKHVLNQYDLYEFLGKTDTTTYISTHPKKNEIELIESLITRYCEKR